MPLKAVLLSCQCCRLATRSMRRAASSGLITCSSLLRMHHGHPTRTAAGIAAIAQRPRCSASMKRSHLSMLSSLTAPMHPACCCYSLPACLPACMCASEPFSPLLPANLEHLQQVMIPLGLRLIQEKRSQGRSALARAQVAEDRVRASCVAGRPMQNHVLPSQPLHEEHEEHEEHGESGEHEQWNAWELRLLSLPECVSLTLLMRVEEGRRCTLACAFEVRCRR